MTDYKKNTKNIFLFLALCMCFSCLVFTAQCSQKTIEFPKPVGYVNDYASILSEQDIQSVTTYIQELQEKTTAEVAVVTMKTVAPYDINDYAVKLFEKWGIGVKGNDNGVLILLALQERKVRIEVGYGLEGILPDGLAGQIIRRTMIPYFKQENYRQGIINGTIAVIHQISREYNVKITGLPKTFAQKSRRPEGSAIGSLFELLFILLFFVIAFGFKSGLLGFFLFGPRRGGYWGRSGGGGFGGGFGGFYGFGGGASGGGGATGGW